ncbi:MAG: DUF4338 domain-containing protein [Chromatiaceae bacterium]|nr:DUF4338 domain-containing protein [Chromatiaceae bacterium]
MGDKPLCGAQLRYLFRSAHGDLGAAACQAASFALQDRDHWIGWNEATRRGNLARVVANARFLILPGVRVPHLASHLLGQLARRLPADWEARYGVRPRCWRPSSIPTMPAPATPPPAGNASATAPAAGTAYRRPCGCAPGG